MTVHALGSGIKTTFGEIDVNGVSSNLKCIVAQRRQQLSPALHTLPDFDDLSETQNLEPES